MTTQRPGNTVFRFARHDAAEAGNGVQRLPAGDLCLRVMDTPNAPNFDATAPPGTAVDLNQQLAQLLERIADGDQASFAEFYRLTSRRVFGMARRVLIDPELSEDTVQEVFLQVWQNAAKFDPGSGSPLAWLMTISHRRAVDRVRSSQSATEREARYGASSQDIDHDSVSDQVDSRLEAEAVVRCLETLTETQQESVRLAYYGGLTYREVAEKLNAAIPTIKSRIRDGLIRLKSCLGVS
ncbi:RNA polymerase ECF-type sigma factor SigK [Arthrobacter globiformis NBRC 12137]|uniref:RNA polymerase ECF-type sigma factor SigK n=2 Tax=Arthrobacter TaxID=1663 RepID=H0QRY7_ARTG1|nr:RNA polymerase ECF-type sigma factor SigK [Arthrobacter globiformis NBRC 12137]